MQLHAKSAGLAAGIIAALYMFCFGVVAWAFGWGAPLVGLVQSWYMGFGLTVPGVIIGAVWGFVDGFICGWLFVRLYNKFLAKK